MKKLFAIANLLLMISFLGCFDSGNDSLGNHSDEAVDFVSTILWWEWFAFLQRIRL
jgi:hypothetical protein